MVKMLNEFNGGSMARTFLIEKNGMKYVRKIAETGRNNLGAKKLKNQWEWLMDFNNEEVGVFPDVSFMVMTKDYSYYDMDYINMPTYRDVLLDGRHFDPELLKDILAFGQEIAKPLNEFTPKEWADNYIMDQHLNKMLLRTKDLQVYDFYTGKTVMINDKEYKNLVPILREISDDEELMKYLKPKRRHRSHGDFTFQNVLTDEIDCYIIDPRGEGPDSIYYDISKLFQSCHGKYDLMLPGNFRVWNDGFTNVINYEFKDTGLNVLFDEIYEELIEQIPHNYEVEHEDWVSVTKFFEASHFISMVPFRLKENGENTLLCYAKGIELLNEFMEDWKNVIKPKLAKQKSLSN